MPARLESLQTVQGISPIQIALRGCIWITEKQPIVSFCCLTKKAKFPVWAANVLLIVADVKGVVAQWCNPHTLQPEQSDRVGLIPSRGPPLEHHDKESQTQLVLSY